MSAEQSRVAPIRFRPRSSIVLAVASLVGLVGFGWPLLIHAQAGANSAHAGDAPVAVRRDPPPPARGGAGRARRGEPRREGHRHARDPRRRAAAALRVPSPGVAGFEPVFFLSDPLGTGPRTRIRLRARCGDHRRVGTGDRRGRARGFPSRCSVPLGWASVRGVCHPLVAGRSSPCWRPTRRSPRSCTGPSSTSGSGPSGRGRRPASPSSRVPASLHNLHSFFLFDLTTSLGFDIPRAVTNSVLVLLLGRPVMAALRRANRRAAFEAPVVFDPAPGST